jgi:DNA-directed RNA polymerase subunit M/transcription elongation factor TFIIS
MDIDTNLDTYIPTQQNRRHVYDKFFKLLYNYNTDNNLENSLFDIKKMALNIERGIYNSTLQKYDLQIKNWNDHFKNLYINKAVIIWSNLNPTSYLKNMNLIKRLFSHEINEFELCYLEPRDLFPERWDELKQLYIKDLEQKQVERPDGILKCGRCKSYKTEYTERQTRSADEPTTKFCYCHNCGNRWRFC